MRTALPLSRVLRDFQWRRLRHIDELTTFHRFDGDRTQIGLTVLTLRHLRERDDFCRFRFHLQGLTLMPSLPTRFLPALLPQTPRFLLAHKTIRRRRQRAIVAIFGHNSLQPPDFLAQ